MSVTKLKHNLLFAVLSIVLGGACLIVLAPRTWAKSAAKGGELFHQKCVMCHGKDGSGNKGMKIPDFRSSDVQKKSDAQLNTIISKGMRPMMPAYEKQLSKEQIDDLVVYIRELGKKKH
jgi:mono/diheme cytochrome c family protein